MNDVPNYERLDGGNSGVEINARVLHTGVLDLSLFTPRLSEKTDVKLYPGETERLYEQLRQHFEDQE